MQKASLKPLLIGTGNIGKFKDISSVIEYSFPDQFLLRSLKDIESVEEPKETGTTFQENSEIKARYYAKISHLPTIADDGGLEIDILNGEPGIHSRRWPGYRATDDELIAFALKKLRGVHPEKRIAHLTTCVSYYDPKLNLLLQETRTIDGSIAEKSSERLEEGYPYKSLFIVKAFNKYYGDLNEKEHEEVNHRRIALTTLLKKVLKY